MKFFILLGNGAWGMGPVPRGAGGLKYDRCGHVIWRDWSRPARGGWIEISQRIGTKKCPASRPARGGWIEMGAMPERIEYDGESEFADVVRGKDWNEVMSVIDELMSTLQVIHPRLYTGVMGRLS